MVVLHDQGKRATQLNPPLGKLHSAWLRAEKAPWALAIDSPPQQIFKEAGLGAAWRGSRIRWNVCANQKWFAPPRKCLRKPYRFAPPRKCLGEPKKVRASQKIVVRKPKRFAPQVKCLRLPKKFAPPRKCLRKTKGTASWRMLAQTWRRKIYKISNIVFGPLAPDL